MATASFSTTYTIQCGPLGSSTFAPSSLNIHLGDTIKWVWVSGTHTTTSTSVPIGAANWDNPLNSTTTSFTYVPAVVGSYTYKCTFHAAMGMTGNITVVSSAGFAGANISSGITMFPNPASGSVHLSLSQPGRISFIMTDVNSKVILKKEYNALAESDIDLQNVANGHYYLQVSEGDKTYMQQLIIAH